MTTSQDTYPEHSHQWILIAYTGERPRVRYRNFGPFPSRQDAIEFMREYKKKYTSPVPISQWLIDPLCNPVGGNPNRLTSSGTVLECRSDTSGEPSMTNDFRPLCAELLRGLDENRHPEVRYPGHLRQIMASARAALAEADKPAVPAPPADGETVLDSFIRSQRPLDPEFAAVLTPDALWDLYEESPAAHSDSGQSLIPDSCNKGLLPMIVSATGDPNEPELERIICSSISGGADYLNGMPRELSLQRITAEGSVFARYIQGPRSPELTLNSTEQPAPPTDGEVAELVGEARYLVRELSDQADDLNPSLELFGLMNQAAANLARTAELLQQMEDLAADAVAGLRYIEESHGRLYGVGWDRVYGKADRLKPAHALPLPE